MQPRRTSIMNGTERNIQSMHITWIFKWKRKKNKGITDVAH